MAELKEDVQEFLDRCDEVLTKVDEIPEKGNDFAVRVEEKIRDMRDWAESADHVTEKMTNALDSMERGVDKWVDR